MLSREQPSPNVAVRNACALSSPSRPGAVIHLTRPRVVQNMIDEIWNEATGDGSDATGEG